jgi:hypothetical protein
MSTLSRYRYYDQEVLDGSPVRHTLDELRHMLRDKTWEAVVNSRISATSIGDVDFFARTGSFLWREAIAVMAEDKIVVLRFIRSTISPNFLANSKLSHDNHSGFGLLPGDFSNGRTGDIRLTDLVLGP